MQQPRDTHLDKVCDICGDVGYGELIITCSQCSIERHIYCMRSVVTDMHEDWVCEVCPFENDVDSLKPGQAEDVLDSSRKHCFELGRQVACQRPKAVETGKVKFLPTEEVIKLSSGSPRKEFPLKSNFRSKPVPAKLTASLSKRSFVGPKTVGPSFKPIKVRSNPSFLQLRSSMPPRCGGQQIISSISQHAVKTPKESKEEKAPQTVAKIYSSNEEPVSSVMSVKEVKTVNAKAMNKMKEALSASSTLMLSLPIINTVESDLVVSNKETVCKGQISDAILPDNKQTILPTKTEETMRSSRPSPSRLHSTIVGSERESWNIRLKVSLFRPHLPALHTTWMGGFKFLDPATLGEFYGGFLARPPCRVHRKAYEFSLKMPPVLQVNLVHQCHLQADILQNGCLDLCDIALYFYPVDYTERSQQNYSQLFQLMDIKNSVLTSYIDGVKLLIFTSKQLHLDTQDLFTRSNIDFFCGVFCHAKDNQMKVHQELPSLASPLEYTHDDNANMNSSEAVDMDIDMVGGKIVGISDTAVSKESMRNFNEWAVKETLDAITNRKFLTVLEDLDSVIQPISVAFEQEYRNDSDLLSKNTEKIKSTLTLEPLEHPLESSLCRLPSSMGETRIPPGFEGLLKLNSSNRAPKAPSAEEKNYLNGRRIVSQVKEEIGCQGILQIAFGVSSPQRQGSIEDYSSRGSQKQHQVLACHLVNDPSAACPPPCLSGKGTKVGSVIKIEGNDNEKPFEMREKKGLQSTLFLNKDKSKMVACSFNGPCAVEVKAEMQVEDDRVNNSHGLHATLPSTMETSQCLWPVASTRVNLSVAGRSRGNDGAASTGGLIRDKSGKWIVGYNLNLGRCGSLSTDLWALFQGIKFTWDRGYRKVLVESDSVAAVECLRKAPSLLDSNIALIKSCRDLLNRKWDCKVYPIRREENLCANWLATHVEGCSPGLSIIKEPPLELNPLLQNDCVRVAHTHDSPSAVSFSDGKSH